MGGSFFFQGLVIAQGGMGDDNNIPLIYAAMWMPALAAVVVKLASERSLAGLGWRSGPARYLALAYIVPLIYAAMPFLAALAVGSGTPAFANWAMPDFGLPETAFAGLAVMLVIGVLFGLVTATGEEIGWRGFLVPLLAEKYGFWGVVIASWLIWTAYHLPVLILGGYAPQGAPIWYSIVCFAAMLLPVTAFMTLLRYRSASFWPAAIAHAAHNFFIQSLFAMAIVPSATTPWLIGEFGAFTAIAVLVVVSLVLCFHGLPAKRSP